MTKNNQGNQNSEAAELVRAGHAMIRIENDTQTQIAIQRPRDEKQIMLKLVEELEAYPDFAKKVFYSIPYKNDTGGTTNVEGVSIKGAMALQRHWRNSASNCRVVEEMDDRIICEGVFMDYETNTRVMRQVSVSRYWIPKGSSVAKPLAANRLEIAIASGMSKAVRNAVNNAVPEYILNAFFQAAKRCAGNKKTVEGKVVQRPLKERLDELTLEFGVAGVTFDELQTYVLKTTGKKAVSETVYGDLLGLLNALVEGHITKEDIFPKEEPAKEKPKEVKLNELIPNNE